jgi:hypothetical protein
VLPTRVIHFTVAFVGVTHVFSNRNLIDDGCNNGPRGALIHPVARCQNSWREADQGGTS